MIVLVENKPNEMKLTITFIWNDRLQYRMVLDKPKMLYQIKEKGNVEGRKWYAYVGILYKNSKV